MGRTLEVVTPEHVAIRYELAGFGSRGVAAALDMALQVLFVALLAGVLSLLVWADILPAWEIWGHEVEALGTSTVTGLIILGNFLIFWGYYIAFETLWAGETPGKRWMGLRVIKDGGYPVDFRAVLVRNLVRPVDVLPGIPPLLASHGFAFIAIMMHPQYKRLGDMAAGTLVVRHGREDELPRHIGFGDAEVFRLLDMTVISQVNQLGREEYRTVQRFLERRSQLPIALRGEFARRLALPLMNQFAYHPPELGFEYERWLEELDLAYRTRALGTATVLSAPSAPTPPPPVVPPTAPPTDTRKW